MGKILKPSRRITKDMKGKNKFLSDEDLKDYEQEISIKKFLHSIGESDDGFDFKYINNKGNPRNFRVRASISLDQKIRKDSTGTFADIIAGSDGRDIEDGRYTEFDEGDAVERILTALNIKGELKKWTKKMLLLKEIKISKRWKKFQSNSE